MQGGQNSQNKTPQTGLKIHKNGLGRSGSDRLSHILRCSTIDAKRFHGPVRDGKGCCTLAFTTGSSEPILSKYLKYIMPNSVNTRGGLTAAHDPEKEFPKKNLCGYEFKPIEQLVLVSFKRYRSSTSSLSTS